MPSDRKYLSFYKETLKIVVRISTIIYDLASILSKILSCATRQLMVVLGSYSIKDIILNVTKQGPPLNPLLLKTVSLNLLCDIFRTLASNFAKVRTFARADNDAKS